MSSKRRTNLQGHEKTSLIPIVLKTLVDLDQKPHQMQAAITNKSNLKKKLLKKEGKIKRKLGR